MSADAGVQRQIKWARISRVLFSAAAGILTEQFAVHLASGAFVLAAMNAFAAVLFAVSVVLAVARIRIMHRMLARTGSSLPPSMHEDVLRRVTHRPRKTMTSGDYQHLRELETELGWEPSEVPESLASGGVVALEPREAPACVCGKSAEEHALEWDEQVIASQGIPAAGPALSGTGTLSAKATWDDVAYPSKASERSAQLAKAAFHFEALANVERESCSSYCPICAERGVTW